MSDEEDTEILLSKGKLRSNYREMTIIIPIQNSPTKRKQQSKAMQVTSIVTLLAGFIFGYDTPNVLCYLTDYANTFELSCIYQSLLFIVWSVGAIIAVMIVRLTRPKCNRTVMIYGVFIIFIGTLIIALSPYSVLVYCGRGLIGFGCILSASSHYNFVGEISDNKWRGFRITLHQFGISIGVFVCLITSLFFKSSEYGWRVATGLNIIPALLHLLLTILFIPQYTSITLSGIDTSSSNSAVDRRKNKISYCAVISTVLVLYLVVLEGSYNGRNTILSYAPTAFIKLGIEPADAQQSVSITISIVQLICTGISLNIIDKLGRKSTLIMSYVIMYLSIVILIFLLPDDAFKDIKNNLLKYGDYCPYFRVVDSAGVLTFGAREQQMQLIGQDMLKISQDAPLPFPLLPTPLSLTSSDINPIDVDKSLTFDVMTVVSILVFEAAYSLGPATVIWVSSVELIPTNLRSVSLADITALYWIVNIFVSGYDSILSKSFSDQIYTRNGLFMDMFICIMIVCLISYFIPETKGRSLHDIKNDLETNNSLADDLKHVVNCFGCCKEHVKRHLTVQAPVQETVI